MCVFAHSEYMYVCQSEMAVEWQCNYTNQRVKTLGPSRPLDVFVNASSSTTIDVKWNAPAESNGVIQNYLIQYGTSPDNQPMEKEVTNRTLQFTLTGLDKFTTYYIKVRGKTSERGNASEVLNATTFEDRKCIFFSLMYRFLGYAFHLSTLEQS